MPLEPEYRRFVEQQLDECDAALVNRPSLAAVFNKQWREEHRRKMLNAESSANVSYPSSYAKPHQSLFYPPDYQQRLDEGASILLPKLDSAERAHFTERMRRSGCLSAEEELLLARGFAKAFGDSSITFPAVPRDKDRPEFLVTVAGRQIEVEAKGLMDSAEVTALNQSAIQSGEMGWISYSSSIGDVRRLRVAAAKKLLSERTGDARILVLTQYTPWIHPAEGLTLLREMAVAPDGFGIPSDHHPLAVAYVTGRWIAGVWFNEAISARIGLDAASKESLRAAVKDSFYPRRDAVFFDETNSDARQQELIAQMIRAAAGG